MNLESVRQNDNWNERFINVLLLPEESSQDAVNKYTQMHNLCEEFLQVAKVVETHNYITIVTIIKYNNLIITRRIIIMK